MSGADVPADGAAAAAGAAAAPQAPAGRPARRRRTVIGLVLGLVVVLALVAVGLVVTRGGDPAGTAPVGGAPAGTTLYVAPRAAGSGDGSSWADAGQLSDVSGFVARLSRGGEILFRADTGPYEVTDKVTISTGGATGAPVVLRGVDGNGQPAKAVLHGTRATPYDPKGASGGDIFMFRHGAAHLAFRDLDFQDVGNAFLAAGNVTDLTVSDVTATNVRRFFEDYKSDSEPSADVTGLVLRNIAVNGFSKRVVRLDYDSHDILLEDVVGDSQQQDGDDFAIGVHLEGRVHDVVLRRVTMRNIRDTLHEYWNGDGFATERDVHDITFEDTVSSGNTDAGYDLKSQATTLVNTTSSDNKRNYRLWADDVQLRDCRGVDPHKRGGSSSQAQVWLGDGAKAQIKNCTFTDSDAQTVVFDLEPDAQVDMTGGTITHAGELERTLSHATVNLTEVNQ
jgi:hypothetical protein